MKTWQQEQQVNAKLKILLCDRNIDSYYALVIE